MGYTYLGCRTVVGTEDQGVNPIGPSQAGNWTCAFSPSILDISQTQFEIFHITVQGAPSTSFQIWIDNFFWDNVAFGEQNSWDPANPMPVNNGQTVYFYYSDAATDDTPPTVTVWLRVAND